MADKQTTDPNLQELGSSVLSAIHCYGTDADALAIGKAVLRVERERFIAAAIQKLPDFNAEWSGEIQDAWWRCFFAIADLVFPTGERADAK